MALTNFSLLTEHQKMVWSRDLWKQARNMSFINKFLGTGPNSLIQHITELKKTEKGDKAVITLLADLQGDGVAGDRQLEGNEEAIQTFDQVITIDQIRHANRHEGKMADQRSVVEFRGNSRNVLAYWLADRIDQMAFQTLAGRSFSYRPDGSLRVGSDLPSLEFASTVTAPSTKRMLRWDKTNMVLKDHISGANTSGDVVATDTPSWQMFVQLKAYAKDRYMRGVGGEGGEEVFHAFLTPQAFAKLKADNDYNLNLRHSTQTAKNNSLFTGTSVLIDGIYLHEFRHVPNVSNGISGTSMYGTGLNVRGSQVLFCGAQALGMADIGPPEWNEKGFDYDNSQGIAIGKILGFLKPRFKTIYENSTLEDFGVLSCYVAQ